MAGFEGDYNESSHGDDEGTMTQSLSASSGAQDLYRNGMEQGRNGDHESREKASWRDL